MVGIKVLEMPKSCALCERFLGACQYTDFGDYQTKRNPNCPLVETEERKKGHWEIKKASIHPYGNDVACSECGFTMGSSFGYKFCPNCGAKMEVEE